MADSLFEFRLLGPIEAIGASGDRLDLGSRKQRALLTVLALARGRVVSAGRLVEELWDGDPPERAIVSLYSYVSNLRRLLEPRRDAPPTVLTTVPPGYVVHLPDAAVDARRFQARCDLVSQLLDQRNWSLARATAEEALTWWRGPALGEFAAEPFARIDAASLEELRRAMVEDLCEARVELHDGHVVADLDRFVSEHPLRERAWALLMRALYANGRQSDALRTFQRARSHLTGELGVEPGPELRELEAAILRHDPELAVARPGSTRIVVRTPAEPPSTELPDHALVCESATRVDPLVGRAKELDVCRSLLDDIGRGPRALLVEGEPGIGKTRLVEAMAELARERNMLVAWGRSPDASGSPALWTWLPALRTLADFDDVDRRPDHIAGLLSSNSSESLDASPSERFAVFDAVVELIERIGSRRPVLIVLDDLQWADVASLELTRALTNRLTAPGVLLAATTRELDIGSNDVRVATLAALTRMVGSRRLKLGGLDRDGTAELLTSVIDEVTDPTVAAAVFDRAEGNPFFTIEIARLISETAPVADHLADVPHSIRDVILRRLEPMP